MADSPEFNDILTKLLRDEPPGYRPSTLGSDLRTAASLYSITEVDSLISVLVSDDQFLIFTQDLNVALGLLAPKDSPDFTGAAKADTPASTDNSRRIATTKFVRDLIAAGFTAAEIAKVAVRYDAAQSLTMQERGTARNNIDAGLVGGFRNKIINGDFDIFQRGQNIAAGTGYRFGADRWYLLSSVSTISGGCRQFIIGSAEVPNVPKWYYNITVITGGGPSHVALMGQKIEGVRNFSGKKATLTFWARTNSTAVKFAIELVQFFGTGGSSPVSIPVGKFDANTGFQKYSITIDVPTILGKTVGSVGDCLDIRFFLDAGSDAAVATSGLGNQSGSFEISHVSVVEGDARAEDDCFSPRNVEQEMALCQRYYERSGLLDTGKDFIKGMTIDSTSGASVTYINIPFKVAKRTIPSVVLRDNDGVTGSISGRINTGIYGPTIKNPASAIPTNADFTVYSNWGAVTGTKNFDTLFGWTADAEI